VASKFPPSFFFFFVKTRHSSQVLDPMNPEHQQWLRSIEHFIFDIDGVLYTGSGAIQGAAEAIAALKRAGKSVRYLTNNSAKTSEQVVESFLGMGIVASSSEVTNSALVAAEFLKLNFPRKSKVYVVGESPLVETLQKHGDVVCFGGPNDNNKSKGNVMSENLTLQTLSPPAEDIVAVVVGADAMVNYFKLTKAGAYLRANPNCLFIGTNPDPVFTLAKGSQPFTLFAPLNSSFLLLFCGHFFCLRYWCRREARRSTNAWARCWSLD
jgi:HAD superfamily hydrolase (TIGR01450 family)